MYIACVRYNLGAVCGKSIRESFRTRSGVRALGIYARWTMYCCVTAAHTTTTTRAARIYSSHSLPNGWFRNMSSKSVQQYTGGTKKLGRKYTHLYIRLTHLCKIQDGTNAYNRAHLDVSLVSEHALLTCHCCRRHIHQLGGALQRFSFRRPRQQLLVHHP